MLILTKAEPTESNTGYAQGGIAAAVGDDDSPALHAADTLRAGDGLCDEAAVRVLVEEGPRYVRELIEWGARFDRDADGASGARARGGAQRAPRAARRRRDRPRDRPRAVGARRPLPSVETINHALVTDLVVEDGRVVGVRYFDRRRTRREVRARARRCWRPAAPARSSARRPTRAVATGDGIALAYHAGARVADLEFVQFHPTALKRAGAPRFLISEALRGEGARLVNARGEPFMTRYHPDGDLAPRDVVARGIVREVGARPAARCS